MRIALVLPPLTQLNTPYPSTAYLARALGQRGIACEQHDLGLALILRLLSRPGLEALFGAIEQLAETRGLPEPAWRALAQRDAHLRVIEPVLRFLQGRDRAVAPRILGAPFLPGGPRLDASRAQGLEAFGAMGVDDAARHLASLYVADLADLVSATVDPDFGLARYQHHLVAGPVRWEDIQARLERETLLDAWLDDLCDRALLDEDGAPPDLVGISVPFPGTLLGGLRMGLRMRRAGATVVMGGGWVSTELREVGEPRLWDCVDALVYDSGEGPLQAIIDQLQGEPDRRHRTRTRDGLHQHPAPPVPRACAADYGALPLRRYLQIVDGRNPAHRLWSDGRWNKLTAAQGCYHARCAFCDTELDYIAGYAPQRATTLADRMDELAQATGQGGFHLVDEAAPPRVLRDLALELLARDRGYSWWGNIRFEAAYSPDLCRLLGAAGLVAVTGGLEVASDRLLALMDKGITVEQAARAAAAFQGAGVMVHAYLMFGFPTQTDQETADSMELVRQLFAAGLLDSAFWHRFVLTRHSRVFAEPERFGISYRTPEGVFATNDIPHQDPTGGDHDRWDTPLATALAAWMRGEDLERPIASWLPMDLPSSEEAADRIVRALPSQPPPMRDRHRLVWLGGEPLEEQGAVLLHGAGGQALLEGCDDELGWALELLDAAQPGGEPLRFHEARDAFPGDWAAFAPRWSLLRAAGLVGV
jgi:hypothetical protein